eukprot:TRINITY_DN1657_c0_g1_i1.p1 TRINITY_DN1657_c0_g1~~TRINITY_DN1657_c0_g1_i1.p1  ORF type:complete len:294 (-),score=31.87 TRINITY_DN1657_c0_g1_i1:85-966(-)
MAKHFLLVALLALVSLCGATVIEMVPCNSDNYNVQDGSCYAVGNFQPSGTVYYDVPVYYNIDLSGMADRSSIQAPFVVQIVSMSPGTITISTTDQMFFSDDDDDDNWSDFACVPSWDSNECQNAGSLNYCGESLPDSLLVGVQTSANNLPVNFTLQFIVTADTMTCPNVTSDLSFPMILYIVVPSVLAFFFLCLLVFCCRVQRRRRCAAAYVRCETEPAVQVCSYGAINNQAQVQSAASVYPVVYQPAAVSRADAPPAYHAQPPVYFSNPPPMYQTFSTYQQPPSYQQPPAKQ